MKAESSSSKKRTIDQASKLTVSTTVKSGAKVFPIFANASDQPSSSFQWISPSLGPKRSCLHGSSLSPPSYTKVAAFDLDGTVIKSSFGKQSKGSAAKWEWWNSVVPSKLKEAHKDGFSIVIISNQALRSTAQITEWKQKIPLIAAALPETPFRLLAATAKDGYRKPMPGMWYELERIFEQDHVQIDKSASFFIGDAAGRTNDFADTDRKWADNVGIPFLTPEEYFLGLPAVPYSLKGFEVSSLPQLSPTSTPIIPSPTPSKPEIVIFVGYPCLGKSTFYKRYFQPSDYAHVNQDTLGTRNKCLKAVEEAVLAGRSCVVDNTNRDKKTRKHYIDLAKTLKASVRCFFWTGSIDLAWHNNLYRAYNLPPGLNEDIPKRDLLPWLAFSSFRDNYDEPDLTEGFTEIKKVNWVFEGREEERKRWSMYLQLDPIRK
ncbi:hypothetical protein JAAARDRAFT_55276 [Jaapia argillacea MUCL 33604]|uniref:PNK FHA domain-containing protein n=1 Tax=Jaapia argillacea MUCL 33604 TaxID=933084 RepID=A0A067Q0E5_9AGAM|nr:hypothetical protein JAAARDRAFT_55276 [Jaapia argillacea MUCL 33604]